MIYADALVGTTNGQTNTALFEESIGVCEAVLTGSASTLVTVLLYHSVGGRSFRKIATITLDPATASVDMHVSPLWPPGQYRAVVSGLVGTDRIYVSFAGEKYTAHNTLDCEIEPPTYGWIPFTASPDDEEEHGRLLYQDIMDNHHDMVGPYEPPIVDEVAVLSSWRSRTEVSRFQAMAALHYAGHLSNIQLYMDTQADVVQKLAWNTAQVFKRMSTTVLALQPLLELSDEQLDDLFKFALTIEA